MSSIPARILWLEFYFREKYTHEQKVFFPKFNYIVFILMLLLVCKVI
jgi:hypothetical protein